jgi:exosortase/archaeosortase family protein
MGEQPLISIADGCNGLNMYALFLGFVIAYPSGMVLKLAFGTLGLSALIGVNVARCVGLAVLQIYYPDFTVFAHHYIFNVLTYAAVFGLWYWFTKKTAR